MNEINLRYALTIDEAISAMRSHIVRSWSMRFLFGAAALYTLVAIVLNWASGDTLTALLTFLPVLVIVGLFIFFYYSPFTRARMKQETRFFIEQTWQFTEEGTTHRTEHGESHNVWSAYVRANETPQFFFLFLSQNIVAPIPKRAFADAAQIAQFRALLKRKLEFESS